MVGIGDVAWGLSNERLITDFSDGLPKPEWYVVNDDVMGGRSEGAVELKPGFLKFTGRTNTHGGGFSSIRVRYPEADLSHYDGIRLRLKGDGRRYTWRLATDARWRGRVLGYWAEFDTHDDEWQTVNLPFRRFVPRSRGIELEGPKLETAKISEMGVMIYDRNDGIFDLEISRISAYRVSDRSL